MFCVLHDYFILEGNPGSLSNPPEKCILAKMLISFHFANKNFRFTK